MGCTFVFRQGILSRHHCTVRHLLPRAKANAMHVDVISSLDKLLSIRSNWETVYQADPEAQLFMSWTWITGWFEGLGVQWFVLAAKESPESADYVAFLPLQLRTERARDGKFANELRTGGGYFAGYAGFLCDPRFDHDAIRAFADHTKQRNWRRLHLENICVSPERLSLFLNEFPSTQFVTEKVQRPDDGDGIDHDIYVYVNLPASWEAFLGERLSRNNRKNARSALRAVETGDEFRITTPTADTVEEDIEALLKLWESQWAAKLAARYHPQLPYGMMNNFRRMMRCCFADNALLLPLLWQGTNRIGIQACLIDRKNRSLICLLGGRDISVKYPPPGFVLHLHCMRWGIENGFETYDLQTGNFSYKYDFGGIERRIECMRVATIDQQNLRGQLDPMSLPVVFARAQGLKTAGDLHDAEQACRQILAVDPDYTDASRLLKELEAEKRRRVPASLIEAKGFHQRGQTSEAENAYRAILKADPNHVEAAYLLGVVFLQQRKFESAEQQIGRVIGLQPNIAAAHYNRGLALMYLNRREEALASFDAAIKLKPDYDLAITQRDNIVRGTEASRLSG
jgi:CelD/BcsL family acetyltransferase involved in cellulose biosynthesis